MRWHLLPLRIQGDEEPAAVEELDLAQLQQALPPGVDVQQVEEMLRSPRGALLADFSAFCQERGFDGELGEAEMSEAMRNCTRSGCRRRGPR